MHNTAYELRISDWSSDVCSSDLFGVAGLERAIGVAFHADGGAVSRSPTAQLEGVMLLTMLRAIYDVRREAMPELLQVALNRTVRSEEHTSELQSLMRISYAVFCLKKKTTTSTSTRTRSTLT